ncbi:hypothetical protein [Desulfosporosinus metallidurans]|uniref:hypothetical protein n=1 Tax=Desulfosporosinus metallidurans TaxID=1888891 RepID=UPI000AA31843|nr:hypothetical protein [Desulfosporosinus metallidurans]
MDICIESIWAEFSTPLKSFIKKRVKNEQDVDDILHRIPIRPTCYGPNPTYEFPLQNNFHSFRMSLSVDKLMTVFGIDYKFNPSMGG